MTGMTPVLRRSVALRRVVLGVYAAGVAVGTHWPRLQMGDPEHPPDKLLHFVSFGGLAFFLWQARYFRSILALFLFSIAWTSVDEITQALPGLGRSFSLEDVCAGSMGVACTAMLVWATRMPSTPVAALRRERFDGMITVVLSEPIGWLAVAVSAAVGITVALPASIMLNGLTDDPTPFQAGVIGIVVGGGFGAAACLLLAMRSFEGRMMDRRLCLGCRGPVPEGATECPSCGQVPLVAQWLPMPALTVGALLRACLPPVLGGIAAILFAIIAMGLYASLSPATTFVVRLNAWWNGLSKGMDSDIHALFLCAVVAVTIERCRARLARRVEGGHRTCLGCGHDLRSTPATDGTGRCGECGAGFVRVLPRNP